MTDQIDDVEHRDHPYVRVPDDSDDLLDRSIEVVQIDRRTANVPGTTQFDGLDVVFESLIL